MEEHFLHLLLNTTKEQRIALLRSVTLEQARDIAEIAYNLSRLGELKRERKFVEYLGNQKHSPRFKRIVIRRRASRLARVLAAYRTPLLQYMP